VTDINSTGWAILRFVREYTDEQGWPPSVREIAVQLERSPGTIHKWLHRLYDLGYIRLGPGARQVVVLDPDAATPRVGKGGGW
jgi:SOS-response transcriptional repressor LexA